MYGPRTSSEAFLDTIYQFSSHIFLNSISISCREKKEKCGFNEHGKRGGVVMCLWALNTNIVGYIYIVYSFFCGDELVDTVKLESFIRLLNLS